jgi:hypothetical protein
MSTQRLAQVEVVDSHGRSTQLVDVHAWPLRIGRALDNDLVLPDPHVAAHHATVAPDAEGRLRVSVGDSRNGVRVEHGHRHTLLRAGAEGDWPSSGRCRIGQSHVTLRRPQDPLPAEVPLAQGFIANAPGWVTPLLLLGIVGLLAVRWVDSDADSKWIDYMAPVLAVGGALFVWGLVWGLASKLFTGRFMLTPHVRLALIFVLAMQSLDVLLLVGAFSFDWPLLSHLRTAGLVALAATWLTQHLRQLQPQRARELSAWVAACTVLGLGVAMATNWHRNDRLLDELYAPHLLPPAWRLAHGVPVSALVDDLRELEQPLRERAAKAKAEDFE